MTPITTPKPLTAASQKVSRVKRAMTAPFLLWGAVFLIVGFALYLLGILVSLVRILLQLGPAAYDWNQQIIWYSGVPTSLGLILCAVDLTFMLSRKRRSPRWVEGNEAGELQQSPVTVVLT